MLVLTTARQQKALDYALQVILTSALAPFVHAIYLYGSCARGTQSWNSDVDLLLELQAGVQEDPTLRKALRLLRTEVSSDELDDAETDLRITIGADWRQSEQQFYKNIQEEGIQIWPL